MSTDRRVGVGVDFSVGSKKAVSWTVENLVRKGDHLILIAVLPRPASHQLKLWEPAGSPLIRLVELLDLSVQTKYDVKPDPDTLEFAKIAADQKKAILISVALILSVIRSYIEFLIQRRFNWRGNQIDVFMKIYWGDPREKLCEAIDNIPLNCLVVGSRGLGSLQRVVMGSVSNHVVNNGSCPVTVVKHHN
ncbi:hypothetical protein V2J09_013704 [Rumex salicifolius]